MKLLLVAMPWQPFDIANAALGSLSAYLEAYFPELSVTCDSAFISLWEQIPNEYEAINSCIMAGELIYMSYLYPEKIQTAKSQILRLQEQQVLREKHRGVYTGGRILDDTSIERAIGAAQRHTDALAAKYAAEYDVVGLTTSFYQLYSSIYIAKKIKQINKNIHIILGGANIASFGDEFFLSYPWVDFLVKGEGEKRLLSLLRGISSGDLLFDNRSGIISKNRHNEELPENSEIHDNIYDIDDLSNLPVPNYDEYYSHADRNNIFWSIPIEASRGCLWDRRKLTGDVLRSCYFCGMNKDSIRRDKTPEKVINEIICLSERYKTHKIRYIDNLINQDIHIDICKRIQSIGRDYTFFAEIRANMSPVKIVSLWEGGCDSVQIGIEGLSTSYLKKLNKGTTTIQNLQAMKTCFELGIRSVSNLIIGFPGCTPEEVSETVKNITDAAICYEPLKISRFMVDVNSAVYERPEIFSVSNFRNNRWYRGMLPDVDNERLKLLWPEFDVCVKEEMWDPVIEKSAEWMRFHQELHRESIYANIHKVLFYYDSEKFLEIIDRRGKLRIIILDDLWRNVYMFIMRIRTKKEILEAFISSSVNENDITDILEGLRKEKLIYEENNQYISLACAWRPDVAARRIKYQFCDQS